MRTCKVCGKEITEYRRRSYCSDKCAREGNRINARGYATPDFDIEQPIKCAHCGKEFVRKQRHQKYCCWQCKEGDAAFYRPIKHLIKEIAKKYGFELKNEDKILRAKKMMFRDSDMTRCPCASQDPDHYCGSPRCIADTVYLGHCCCQLFWSKKEPLINKHIEKQEK